MSNSLLLEEVESFVRKERGLPKSKVITSAATLEDDLGITGIEGEMFMEAFFARFKVDEGDFASGRYFMDEGSALMLMLVTAAGLGRWDSAKVENGGL